MFRSRPENIWRPRTTSIKSLFCAWQLYVWRFGYSSFWAIFARAAAQKRNSARAAHENIYRAHDVTGIKLSFTMKCCVQLLPPSWGKMRASQRLHTHRTYHMYIGCRIKAWEYIYLYIFFCEHMACDFWWSKDGIRYCAHPRQITSKTQKKMIISKVAHRTATHTTKNSVNCNRIQHIT